ncbi:MAG: cobalamin-dependent protein [Sedimentisphaerales bacterium]|nr:cobalamin-dependent protein [Sedimentisphaerales bacterium]
MKILMISANIATSPYPVFPLGMGMVTASLKSNGHEVTQFDFLQNEMSLDKLIKAVQSVSPDLIGISIRNIDNVNLIDEECYIDTVKSIVQTVHNISTVPVILGGSGFSILPLPTLKQTGADYGIVGEGEKAILKFVSALERGEKPVEPVIYAEKDLENDDIPSTYYDSEILKFYQEKGYIVSIQTKRGCNKRCVYCSYPVLEGSKIRVCNPGKIVDDLLNLHENFNAGHIFFVDSVFNDSEGLYRNLIDEMIRRKVRIPWMAFFTPDKGLDDEIIEKMKLTGLEAAEIGADATTDTTLKGLGKDFLFKDIINSNELFLKHGVATAFYYMFGGPGETKKTVFEGIENICSLRQTANFIFMGIRVLPGTPLARLAIREGIISRDDDLFESVYYISPGLDTEWLEKTLTEAFADKFNCVFPPNSLDEKLHLLQKMRYSCSRIYDLLGRNSV